MAWIYTLLLLVMLMWGLNVSAIKVLVDAIDPMLLTAFQLNDGRGCRFGDLCRNGDFLAVIQA